MRRKQLFMLCLFMLLAMTACSKKEKITTPVETTAHVPVETTAPHKLTEDEVKSPALEQRLSNDPIDSPETELYSIAMPSALADKYYLESRDDAILFFDKEARNAGEEGYAFGIYTFADPKDGAWVGKKVGELTSADGTVYDVRVHYPQDVTEEKDRENHRNAEAMIENLTAKDGGSFKIGAGVEAEDSYDAVKKQYENVAGVELKDIDVNHDDIQELVVENENSIIELYTMANREPKKVELPQGEAYLCGEDTICITYEDENGERYWKTFLLSQADGELTPQISLKEDIQGKHYVCYRADDFWDEIDDVQWEELKKITERAEEN